MRNRLSMLLLMAFVFVQGLCLRASAQTNDYDDSAPVQVGFVVITPPAGFAGELIVFETFGLNQGGTQIYQAGIIPGDLTTEAMIFVSKSPRLSRDIGLALVNPGASQAKVTMTLRRDDGIPIGSTFIFIPARRQTAQFVSELFKSVLTVPEELPCTSGEGNSCPGTLILEADNPVGVTVLRRRGPSFSTMPITNVSPSKEIPVILPGVGGPGAILLPHFVAGGGGASEIVIVNNSNQNLINLRVDLFKQNGTPLTTGLNHVSGSTFFVTTLIRPGGVFTLAPRDANGDSRF